MIDDPLFDYENDVISNEKAEELETAGFNNDIKTVMSDRQGRKLIAMILYSICDIDGKQFTGNSQTYFNLGKRDVGRFLSELIQQEDFENYILMLRELRDGFIDKKEVNNE